MTEDVEIRKIPCTMSTQHPDNVAVPEWCSSNVIDGDTEIDEAYFAFKTIGCHEVMWDSEGKDTDTRVVRKLLSKYGDYFREHLIGRDVFITYRIPNPNSENVEKKVAVETLQNITVAKDVASAFYKEEVAPIFEVILPYTTDGRELIWLHNYYKKAIVSVGNLKLGGSKTVKDWFGDFKPKEIQVIPLIEDFESTLSIDKIIGAYMDAVKPRYLRVFVARSDPALNYGLFCAAVLSKIALSRLKDVEKKRGIPVHPILGAGSMPFRGHLSPENVENFLKEYKGLTTVTVQSAFRYDYPIEKVKEATETLNKQLPNDEAMTIEAHEEKILIRVLNKFRTRYGSIVEDLAPLVNSIAAYIPQRRARKLHVGLFGYSRSVGNAILPRAIPFAATFYSLGIPPEFLGARVLGDLREDESSALQRCYLNMKEDLRAVGGYLSWQNMNMLMDTHQAVAERAKMEGEKLEVALTMILEDLSTIESSLGIKLGSRSLTQRKHENFTNNFLMSYLEHEEEESRTALLEAARLRRCLG
jgi:phosphoenolpyruvate carboxylase